MATAYRLHCLLVILLIGSLLGSSCVLPAQPVVSVQAANLTVVQRGSIAIAPKRQTPANQPPTVDLDGDVTLTAPASIAFEVVVSDDGLPNPPSSVTTLFEITGYGLNLNSNDSGTQNITLDTIALRQSKNAFEIDFFQPGQLTFTVIANDGALSTTKQRVITVVDAGNTSTPTSTTAPLPTSTFTAVPNTATSTTAPSATSTATAVPNTPTSTVAPPPTQTPTPIPPTSTAQPTPTRPPVVEEQSFDSYLPLTVKNGSPAARPNPDSTLTLIGTIGNRTIALGTTFILKLGASIAPQQNLNFGAKPLPLPENAKFETDSGIFTFRPDASQVGTYVLTFSATDGNTSVSETVTLTVAPANPNQPTALQGRILDANAADAGQITPLFGATVRLVNDPSKRAITNNDGYFTLNNLEPGENYVEFDGSTATPAGTYGAYRSKQELIANVTNVIDRPIYIMAIDRTGQIQIDPNKNMTLVNPSLGVTVTIEAHTVMRDDGSEYTGPISISEVPDEFTPSSLPDWLDPAQVFTVQPMGLTFARPAKVTFPNTTGLPVGSVVTIWSMDHETSRFFEAGQGQVISNDLITTTKGGIQESSWHFPMPPPADKPELEPDNPADHEPPIGCGQEVSSMVEMSDGCLRTTISLPAYVSQGEARGLTFLYSSARAYPFPMLSFNVGLPTGSGIPDSLSYSLLDFGGLKSGKSTYVDTSQLFDANLERIRGVVSIEGSNFATGIYSYTVRVTKHYADSGVAADLKGSALLVNERENPFGSGWELAGLQRLYPQPDGRVLLTDGDGSAITFYPIRQQIGGFDEARGGDYSFLSGSDFEAARDDIRGNFADLALTEFNTLTSDALQGTSILVLSSQESYLDPLQEPLSASEQSALSDFVRAGGCAILMVDENNSNGANESLLDVFSMSGFEATGSNAIGVPVPNPSLSPVTSGRFGEVPNFVQHFAVGIKEPGPYATSLASNQKGIALAVIKPNAIAAGSGPVIIFSDTDMFSSGPASQVYTRNPVNPRLWLNSVDYCRSNSALQATMYRGANGDYSTLVRNNDGGFTRRMKDGTILQFNAAGRQTSVTDRNGNRVAYTFDTQGKLMRITDPVGQEYRFTYDGNHLKEIVDPAKRKITFAHDAEGRLTQVTYPDTTVQKFGYDNRHLMTSETDRRGFVRTRAYDAWGRLESASLPGDVKREITYSQSVGLVDPASGLGTAANPAPVTRPAFDLQGTLTDGEGHTSGYRVNALGQATAVTEPSGLRTIISRDSNGNPTIVYPPSYSTEYHYEYDQQGNLISFQDRDAADTRHHSEYRYDNQFNQLTSFSLLNVGGLVEPIWTFDYDDRGNLIKTNTPLKRSVQIIYDSQGLPLTFIDSLNRETRFTYNASGNPTQIASGPVASQRVTGFSYTDAGYVNSLTDSLGRTSTYSYDALGRVTQEVLPGNRTVSYGYDEEGNLTTITPSGRTAHRFTYDGLGLVTDYMPPAVPGSGTTRTSYTYNKAQQLTQITRPEGKSIHFSYDDAGRIIAQIQPRGTITYSYGVDDGRLSRAHAPDGVQLAYRYEHELLSGVSLSGPVEGTVGYYYDEFYRLSADMVLDNYLSYVYDADGALTHRSDFNRTDLQFGYDASSGLLTTSKLDRVSDQRSYNAFGEVTAYSAFYNTMTPLFSTTYVYDVLGRITTLTETIDGVTTVTVYSYDAAGRLDSVQKNGAPAINYAYDGNGNRLPGNYDAQDRLLSNANGGYTYTANGELLTKTDGGGETRYDYDVMGNLMEVTLPGGKRITYLVDAQNRRIGRMVNGELTQGFLYLDQLNPIAEVDTNGNLVSRFIYGSKPHVPDAMIRDGVNYRIISDHLGSVRLVVNTADGTVMQRVDYDAWGNVINDTNEGFQPFGFAGGLYDHETGLVRFGARDYNAEIGRWTTKDPIGFESGDANLYVYVGNDPINFVDPLGLLVIALYDEGKGILSIVDSTTRELLILDAESGGKPFGDPIPFGTYHILDHPKIDFFRLEPLDSLYGNDTHESTGRYNLRLHKPGRTTGCIAAKDQTSWQQLRDLIRFTETEDVIVKSKSFNPFAPENEIITRFGTLIVINSNNLVVK